MANIRKVTEEEIQKRDGEIQKRDERIAEQTLPCLDPRKLLVVDEDFLVRD